MRAADINDHCTVGAATAAWLGVHRRFPEETHRECDVKFSVLLPTRNGAPYLRDTIASVLSEDYPEFELVVSDNASNSETQRTISEFSGDTRLKVIRQETPLTVTDNWNAALFASSGEYVLMLGDDDCVMPRCFHRLEAALARHAGPDCVTFNGYSFVFPNSINNDGLAYFASKHFSFGPEYVGDAELSRSFRRTLVEDMYRFRVRFPLNMQLTLFSRASALRLAHGVFRPPFPDHYALVSFLLTVDRLVYLDERLVVVGISPKSFGHFFYSGDVLNGIRYLGIEQKEDGRLPGNELLNNMRDWLRLVKGDYPQSLEHAVISEWDYVGRQVHYWARQYEFGKLRSSEALALVGLLSWSHKVTFALPLFAYRYALKLFRSVGLRHRSMLADMWPAVRPLPGITSITEFAKSISTADREQ